MSIQRKLYHLALQLLLTCGLLVLATDLRAAEREYSQDVRQWQEIPLPPRGENPDRVVWENATGDSNIFWRVSLENTTPIAELTNFRNAEASEAAPFDAKPDGFSRRRRFQRVDDGWLVSFNHGEFGAGLYWFDPDGRRHYRISSDHIIAFLSLPDGVYAIEGIEHMASCGSLIRIERPTISARWQASKVVRLPSAPYAAVVRREGSILIALSYSLVSVGPDHHVTTLISDDAWAGPPLSMILAPDESRLYMGMRQFVGEVDLKTNRLRLLVPSESFLHKLPEDVESHIRAQYPRGRGRWQQPDDLCEKMEEAATRNSR